MDECRTLLQKLEKLNDPKIYNIIAKLKKERFTLNELEEKLRSKDITNLGDVEYAILETSGDVSVIQKPNKRNTKPEDFNIMPEYEGIPYNLVIDGKIMSDNLKKIGENYDWLKKQTNKFQMNPEEALIVTIKCKRTKKMSKAEKTRWKTM